MITKTGKIIMLVGLAVLVLATWHVAAAKSANRKKAGKPALPPAAAAAIKKAFPKAAIGEVERETVRVVLYEVELKQNRKEIEVQVTSNGQIVEVGKAVARKDLPKAVARTLARLAGDARIREIEREETRAVFKLVKLKKPLVVYEAEFVRNGKEIEVRIAPDGTLLAREVEEDEDDDDDDDEEEVSIDQVPPAVKATILKEAGKNKIEEIEVETRGGKKIYEAEWTVGGKEIEIRVAADGKLLSKEVEDDD